MTFKTIFFSLFCVLFLAACGTQDVTTPKYIKTHEGKMQIITNSTPLTIHTKMIVGDKADVITYPGLGKDKLVYQDQKQIDGADIIITQDMPRDFSLSTVSQIFRGTHLTMIDNLHQQIISPLSETLANIHTIRDTVAEIDPMNHGTYFDNAGNYENNLQNIYKVLQQRIDEYNKKPFLIFGDHMGVFLEEFGLSQYITATFPQTFEEDAREALFAEIEKQIERKSITIAFVEKDTAAEIRAFLESKGITIYQVNDIEEDTSSWGYIRFIEKIVGIYVNAFNAYD